jgi:hypothetical protein
MVFQLGRSKSKKNQLSVILESEVIESSSGSCTEVLVVRVVNEGNSDVVLVRVGIMLEDGRKFFFPSEQVSKNLPMVLEPGALGLFAQEVDQCFHLLKWEGYVGAVEFSALVVDEFLTAYCGEIVSFEIN